MQQGLSLFEDSKDAIFPPVTYQLKPVKAASAALHCVVAERAHVSSSGPGATDQGEGAQSTAAVWADGGGALEEAGGAETKGGTPQSCGGGEEEAAAWGGEGEHTESAHTHHDRGRNAFTLRLCNAATWPSSDSA